VAQGWADRCEFKHSGGKYGENIYASAGANTTSQDVVDSWMGEADQYDYAANSCAGTCGHYTQVVWRKSTSLAARSATAPAIRPFRALIAGNSGFATTTRQATSTAKNRTDRHRRTAASATPGKPHQAIRRD